MRTFYREGVGDVELFGVKVARESAQLGRTKVEGLHPVAGEIQFPGNRKGKVHDAIVTGESHDVALKIVILVGGYALQGFSPTHQVSAFRSEPVDRFRARVEIGARKHLGSGEFRRNARA